jgi:hypothetical protein
MTTSETITFLRNFNGWRRGAYDKQPPRAQEVGKAIDDACDKIEQLNESNAVLLADMRHYREMAEELLEKNAKQAVEIVRLKSTLQDIAALDTSQDAGPQQCASVLLAMNALDQ